MEGGFLRALVQLFAPQNRVHPLDGADAHLHILGDVGTFQPPHPIDFRKRTVIVVGAVGQEFPFRLFAQSLGVHQKENPVDLGVFQQAIYRRDGRKGLARAGGHLDQCSGAIAGERALQIFDGRNLTASKAGGIEGRKPLHIVANGVRRF